jgi:hypothetical protein
MRNCYGLAAWTLAFTRKFTVNILHNKTMQLQVNDYKDIERTH